MSIKKLDFGLVFLALTVTACSSAGIGKDEYSCPGRPNGALCKGPIEIYNMTNSADHVLAKPAAGEPSLAGRGIDGPVSSPIRLQEPLTQPLPVLEPARVLRIWIAPWIDATGDLHFPSFLFTEITRRQWTFGENAARNAQIVVPLQVDAQWHSTGADDEEVLNRAPTSSPSKAGDIKSPSQTPLQPIVR